MRAGLFVVSLLMAASLIAQSGGTLSGTVTGPAGTAVPNAKVTVKNLATGQSTEAQTNAEGLYSVPNLAPGEYELTAVAEGFQNQVAKVTLAAGPGQKTDLS